MGDINNIAIGDILILKKKHPCGSQTWEVMRTGMDVSLRCQGCSRVVRMERSQFRKQFKKKVVDK